MKESEDRRLYVNMQKITLDFKYSDGYNYRKSDLINLSNVENTYKPRGWQQFLNDNILSDKKDKKDKLKINFEGD